MLIGQDGESIPYPLTRDLVLHLIPTWNINQSFCNRKLTSVHLKRKGSRTKRRNHCPRRGTITVPTSWLHSQVRHWSVRTGQDALDWTELHCHSDAPSRPNSKWIAVNNSEIFLSSLGLVSHPLIINSSGEFIAVSEQWWWLQRITRFIYTKAREEEAMEGASSS